MNTPRGEGRDHVKSIVMFVAPVYLGLQLKGRSHEKIWGHEIVDTVGLNNFRYRYDYKPF
jgi:hypothetical protein